jgi:hypothetical protein
MALATGTDPQDAWSQTKKTARQFRIQVPAMNARLLAGGVSVDDVIDIYRVVKNAQTQLAAQAVVTGLNAYVQTLPGKSGYNAVAEIGVVTSAMQAVLDWIDTNASGLSLTGDTAANAIANGSIATNRFGAGATAALRANLSAIESAIDAA